MIIWIARHKYTLIVAGILVGAIALLIALPDSSVSQPTQFWQHPWWWYAIWGGGIFGGNSVRNRRKRAKQKSVSADRAELLRDLRNQLPCPPHCRIVVPHTHTRRTQSP